MAQFNLADYETVEQRIKRFYSDHPDGRIVTENLTTLADRSVSTWVTRSFVYLTADDQANNLPKATGMAFEIDGTGMANKTSALENAETSSIGRALANANYSGNKRATREEMAKVSRDTTPAAPTRAWAVEAQALAEVKDIEGLRALYSLAVSLKVSATVLEEIKGYANGLSG